MKTMTVRNVPDRVADGLFKRASGANMSVNAVVVSLLSDAILGENPFHRKRDLSAFCGGWSDADLKEFDDATESTRRIEPEDWK